MGISELRRRFFRALHVIKLLMLWPIVVLMPRDSKKILFGAWKGRQFSDNPKYFMKFLIGLNQGFKCYWVGDESLREKVSACGGVEFVRKDSFRAVWHILTTRWMCCNLGIDCDITRFPTYGRVKMLSFWHGTSIKGVANKPALGIQPNASLIEKICGFPRWLDGIACPYMSYASFSYEGMRFIMPMAVPWAFSTEKSVVMGTARIDYLIRNCNDSKYVSQIRQKYAKILNLPLDKKWYLYMPTWRNGLAVDFSFSTSTRIEEYQSILERQGVVLIEKQHPQVMQALGIKGGQDRNIKVVSADENVEIDVQELLLASDCLISDYSSCVCDFETMNRPVIHFVYDLDVYSKSDDRAEMQDLSVVAAGPLAKNEDQMLECLSMSCEELLSSKGAEASRLVEGERGSACESFAKWVGLVK